MFNCGKRHRKTQFPFLIGILTICLGMLNGSFSQILGLDTVRVKVFKEGVDSEKNELGTIQSLSPQDVVLLDSDGQTLTIPVDTILWIKFDQEPIELTTARTTLQSSNYDKAQEKLSEISEDALAALPDAVRQEVAFCRILAEVQPLMLENQDEKSLFQAGKQLNSFIKNYPQSYHYYEANQMMASILLMMGKETVAQSVYKKIAQAPWPALRLSAQISLGQIALLLKNNDEAQSLFESVLNNPERSTLADPKTALALEQFARIGLAQIEAERDQQTDLAISKLVALIDESDAKNTALQARLYNVLGDLYQLQGKQTEAILAYLHVDLLFSLNRYEHRRALQQLNLLWNQTSQPERAEKTRQTLQVRYGIAPDPL